VRTTVYLATVLFLVGIGGHFRVRSARLGLISVAGVILAFSCVLLILAPSPPL
jgi:NADH:ubiquinone oxidoreductase subunit K